jgi:hypothetical protein
MGVKLHQKLLRTIRADARHQGTPADVDPPRVADGFAEGSTNTLTYQPIGRTNIVELRYDQQ